MKNVNDYQKWAKTKEAPDYTPVSERLKISNKLSGLLHACLGMSGEAGEFLDTVKKSVYYGKPLDEENLKEELGDICYYLAIACSHLDVDFSEILNQNVEKLEKRYPSGFTEKNAQLRLDKETK